MPELQHLISNTNETLKSLLKIKSELFEKLQLSIEDRVKLFSKFFIDGLQSENKIKQSIKSIMNKIKFKQGRNLNLNYQILPSKSELINITRSKFKLEYTNLLNLKR